MYRNSHPMTNLLFRLFLAGLVVLSLAVGFVRPVAASTYGEVVISEIMYDPATGGEENEEWVELYNPTTASIDISGWVLTDDNTFPAVDEGQCTIPASTSIPAGGFVVISRAAIPVINTEIVCTASGTYQLENVGDNLALFNTAGEMIFGSLEYLYPDTAANNLGHSIGLKNPTAGWAPNTINPTVVYWSEETTPDATPFTQHTAGAANSGWTGNITTPHTITSLDGTVNTLGEWQPGELLGSADTATFYLTWDATDIYIGFAGGNAQSDKYNVLVDIDPLDMDTQNSGNTLDYCGASFGANGKPDYAIQLYPGGIAKNAASGSSWDTWTAPISTGQTNGGGAGSGQAEFRLSKAELGINSDAPVGFYLYACTAGNRVWATWPPENKIDTTNPVAQTTRVLLDATRNTRSPRDDAAHLGYETFAADTLGVKLFFDDGGALSQNWHGHLNVSTAGAAGCLVTAKVLANHLVSRLDGGTRRSYTITPDVNCTGLAATVSLKYEDGWDNNQTQTDINFIPSELRGLDENSLILYRNTGATWDAVASNRSTTHNRVVTTSAVTQFSTWTFGYAGHIPTAVTLQNLTAQSSSLTAFSLLVATGLLAATGLLTAGTALLFLRRKVKTG